MIFQQYLLNAPGSQLFIIEYKRCIIISNNINDDSKKNVY